MWKLVIADDERLIVKGLSKMIDWESLNVEIAGVAYDGEQLKRTIEYADPDIVLTDIMMPYMTGLELLHWYNARGGKAKFIFVSGYQEFSYVQEALKNGAVDYLLKPVGEKELEEAVRKTICVIERQNTVEIFDEKKDEFQTLFEGINNGRNYENEELYRVFRSAHMTFEDCFFVGVCAGICPDEAARLSGESFGHFNLLRFSVFNKLNGAFGMRRLGFVIRKDQDCIHIVGVFPNRDRDVFMDKYVNPIRREVEEECGVRLCMGVGGAVREPSGILQSYKEARFAFGLYPFEEQPVIDFADIHHDYSVSFEDFAGSVEAAFRAIISKDPQVLDKIDQVMDTVENIHYGNWKAVVMRTMIFTGDLGMKLSQYRLLDVDFYQMQDCLQKQVESQHTMSGLRRCIHEHYADLIQQVYAKGRSQDKVLIEDVKNYIREHYMEDLSIRELAEVACVSQNYFSAMFKKETGQNYKAYLTSIRMEEALRLLQETDLKTYEIGEKVGYNNVRRFVDAFKQIYAMSPMEYKKSMKRGGDST